jgi:RNA polymerase sigma-70 factor (ECF subfamily)
MSPERGTANDQSGPVLNRPELTSLPDAELLQLTARRDEAAFAELFHRFSGKVTNLAYRYLGNRDDAELIAQDAFLKVWNYAHTFRGSSSVWTWLFRIAVNLCLTLRARKRWPVEKLDENAAADMNAQPERVFSQKETQTVVERALKGLPPDQRMAIMLSHYEDMSYEEIAQTMNKSVKAVATLLFRARENLRVRLTPMLKRGKISP